MNKDLKLSQFKEIQGVTLNIARGLRNDGVSGNKGKVYDLTDLENILHVSRRSLFKWKSEGEMRFSQDGKKNLSHRFRVRKIFKINKEAL